MDKIIKNAISKLSLIEEPYVDNVGSTISFTIQTGPIKEVGVNGCQITALIEVAKNIIEDLNTVYPCRENSLTITKLEEALHWQEARTKDRERRKVEGENKI